MPGSLSRLTA